METKERLVILGDCSAEDTAKIQAAVETAFEAYVQYDGIILKNIRREQDDHVFFLVTTEKGDLITQFRLRQFPNCRHLVVSTDVVVFEKYQGKGYGRMFNDIRTRAMSLAGYSKILATVNENNQKEIDILIKSGWTKLSSFASKNHYDTQTFSLWERLL